MAASRRRAPRNCRRAEALGGSGILFVGDRGVRLSAFHGGPPANCNFDFGALLTETALLGVMAVRTGKYLVWDAENARVTNDAAANELVAPPYRAGWSL